MNTRDDIKPIVHDISEVTGVPEMKIMQEGRGNYAESDARFMLYAIMYRGFDVNIPQISRIVGRTHGSVSMGIKRILDLEKVEKKTARHMNALREKGYTI